MLFRLARCLDRWPPSEFTALPPPGSTNDAERRDYLAVAAGLAALLARCSPRVAERELPCTLQAFRALRVQVRRNAALHLPAQLLNDLSHEIALCADAPTRAAALRCLRRRVSARPQLQFA